MSAPLVSVVIETITARFAGSGSLADDLGPTLAALDRQTYPSELIEPIVVLDCKVPPAAAAKLCARHPKTKLVCSLVNNYFAAKNAGAVAALGEIVAMVDSDCEPDPKWIESLATAFDSDVAAVAGRTRYQGRSWAARTFSIPDFSYILAEDDGMASGFNISNVAFQRHVITSQPFDTRIARDGGCYLLFHQLRARGARVIYQPRAIVEHRLDFQGLGFVRKHFNRGYGGVAVYKLDNREVLRGTRFLRRFGALGLVGITGHRILIDCGRMVRHRRQIGIHPLALPYFATVGVVTRCIEMIGGLAAIVASR